MLGQDRINTVIGQDVYGSDGAKIGTARHVFADDGTGEPEWMTVVTGLSGTKETFIPLSDVSVSGDQLTVPYDKEFVKNAPAVDEDAHLSADQERRLSAYYGAAGS